MPVLLTPHDLSERTGIPETTLAQHRYQGRGYPFIKIEGAVRYRLSDVEAYEASAVQPQPAA